MDNVNTSHFDLLGYEVKDAVTGYTGVVTSLSFDLYGCIQGVVTPPMDKDKKIDNGNWFDVTRLVVLSKKPVMPLPNFSEGYIAEGKKGCSQKPMPN